MTEIARLWADECAEVDRQFVERYGDVPRIGRTWMEGTTLHYEVRPLFPQEGGPDDD